MDDHPWTQPLQAVDIAPERQHRLPWLNPTTVLTVSIVGYFFSFSFSKSINLVFAWIGLIGLIVGFVLLVNQSVEAAIHRQVPLVRRLALNWLLLLITLAVGVYLAPLVGRIIGKF